MSEEFQKESTLHQMHSSSDETEVPNNTTFDQFQDLVESEEGCIYKTNDYQQLETLKFDSDYSDKNVQSLNSWLNGNFATAEFKPDSKDCEFYNLEDVTQTESNEAQCEPDKPHNISYEDSLLTKYEDSKIYSDKKYYRYINDKISDKPYKILKHSGNLEHVDTLETHFEQNPNPSMENCSYYQMCEYNENPNLQTNQVNFPSFYSIYESENNCINMENQNSHAESIDISEDEKMKVKKISENYIGELSNPNQNYNQVPGLSYLSKPNFSLTNTNASLFYPNYICNYPYAIPQDRYLLRQYSQGANSIDSNIKYKILHSSMADEENIQLTHSASSPSENSVTLKKGNIFLHLINFEEKTGLKAELLEEGAEEKIKQIFIWNVDNTFVLLEFMKSAKYAQRFNKNIEQCREMAIKCEHIAYTLARTYLFLDDLENCNHMHINDVTMDESQINVSSYNFVQDGFQDRMRNMNESPLNSKNGVDFMKKLSLRYMNIKNKYQNFISNPQDFFTNNEYTNWLQTMAQMDEYLELWLSTMKKSISLIKKRKNCVNIAITSDKLIPILSKIMVHDLANYFDIDNIYSYHKSNIESCYERIKAKYANDINIVVVGSQKNEEVVSKTIVWPFFKISDHSDIAALYYAVMNSFL
ncbi:hypothetical protein A3Q56_00087 [Intoshia linei]|uniref:Eyes absent homolog n=1 Tax=Intoshia linei TaxID=1819745 RepID=A0A177BD89_9BILA|nr:hypothetical protein A3Q56_00087 [Intoshia linei]